MTNALPPIHEWWPELSIESRHRLWEAPGGPIDEALLEEIASITGEAVPDDATLSEDDRAYIATQSESVD